MLTDFLLAILLPPIMLLAWVAVQNAWRKQFHAAGEDADVLATRGDCGRCGCTTPCHRDDGESKVPSGRT